MHIEEAGGQEALINWLFDWSTRPGSCDTAVARPDISPVRDGIACPSGVGLRSRVIQEFVQGAVSPVPGMIGERTYLPGLVIPSFLMRNCSVERLIPSRAAAPL